jgi:biopolymer transport protein ExbB
MTTPQNSDAGKSVALTGLILLLFGPMSGLLGTVIGMMSAFHTLGSNGIGDPKSLATNIGVVLWATVLGLTLGLIGMVLIFISLFLSRYRAPWFFWFLVIDGALMLFTFPIGTVIGTALLAYCLIHKDEFLGAQSALSES